MTAKDARDDKNKKSLPPKKLSARQRFNKVSRKVLVATVLAAGVVIEAKTSYIQSRIFSNVADGKTATTLRTTSATQAAPAAGPYDERLGYADAIRFRHRLSAGGYELEGETTWQERNILGVELFPIYDEKSQAGLKITDEMDQPLLESRFPRNAYKDFDSIPPILIKSLLYVENRDLLDDKPSTWNPAIEWERLANALIGYGMKKTGLGKDNSGGSTLATQIEKFRHSPEGITGSPSEKMKQMLTASVRAYQDGGDTRLARQRIVLDYLNSMPLSSFPGYGEVNGFADGMAVWFGADFHETTKLLKKSEAEMSEAELRQFAKTYREALNLVMAVKEPSAYLLRNRTKLQTRVDNFLPLLVEAGIISPRMKELVMAESPSFASTAPKRPENKLRQKSADALQVELLRTLNVHDLYTLNHLDLTARTTIDSKVDAAVSEMLRKLTDPEVAKANGMVGYQLLKPDAAQDITYSFTLYEKTADGTNVLRVQADNFNGPLNLNEGTKMELGSTAKLRTLVSYLEAMADLHSRYAAMDAETLSGIPVARNDALTRWAVDYLSAPETDKSLNGMLEAALERTYSGSPREAFFTGGGLHRFENFEKSEDFKSYNVKDAFHHSVNLSFVRIMKDVVHYTQSQKMNIDADIFENQDSPQRRQYLEKFADAEGTSFLWQFWSKQKGKNPEEIAALLAAETRRTPVQLAVVYRSLFPDAAYEDMEKFIRKECPNCSTATDFKKTYEAYAQDKFNLNDRGYLARIHPLALWLASYKIKHPDATWSEAVRDSAAARIETYKWLLESNKMQAQNTRIQIMLEKEAFTHIHKTWKDLGYSFSTLVPSYASALGASGDTPAALAKLAGILQNDGLSKQPLKFREIDFADKTPYAMHFRPAQPQATRVLPPELTRLVRREMQGVVAEGTARRAHQSIKLSDGRILEIGAKTGTGDNRIETYAANGTVKSSNAKSRTATFVFTIDDRFYGCMTAFVSGPNAGDHKFTSALSAQVFKTLAPTLRPVLDRAYGITPDNAAAPVQDKPEQPEAKAKAKPPAPPSL